jgi:pyruvate dehydrogenase E2 component (dihydrolipoamide acetyltransferase)
MSKITSRSDHRLFSALAAAQVPLTTSLEVSAHEYGQTDGGFSCSFLTNGTHIHSYASLSNANNEAIVFLHAMGGNNKNWLQIIAQLRPEVTCIAIDLPLHGATTQDDNFTLSDQSLVAWLYDVLGEIPAQKIHLAGHSMGARVAALYASTYPGAVQSLNLFNPAISPSFRFATNIDIALIKGISALQQPVASQKTMEFILSNMLIRKTKQTKVCLKYAIHEMVRDQQDNNFQGIVESMRWMESKASTSIYDWAKILQNMPVAIIAGEKDVYCPTKNFENELPSEVDLIRIKNGGHLIPLEHAGICANTIRKSITKSKLLV